MPAKPITKDEHRGGRLYWLLTVEWASRQHRWATDPVVITTADGTRLPFSQTMAVDFAHQVDLFSLAPTSPVSFRELHFDSSVDVALLIEQGRRLERAPAELSMWMPGRTWEERRVVLRGRVSLPDYGGAGEPVAFTLEPETADDRAIIPASVESVEYVLDKPNATSPNAVLRASDIAWPSYSTRAVNRVYPLVFGQPFYYDASALPIHGDACGSPAWWVDTNTLLIAGHHVQAATVTVVDITQESYSEDVPVVNTVDGLGNLCATVDVTAGGAWYGAITPSVEDEYQIIWDDGGGLRSRRYAGQAMTGAGEVMEYLLGLSTVRVDRARFAAVAPILDQYTVAGVICDQVSPWKWVAKQLLPLLPVSLVAGPDGWYPVVWDPTATAKDAVAHLYAEEGLYRVGAVQIDRGDIANELSIGFAPRGDDGTPRLWRTVTGRPVGVSDPAVYETQHTRASALAYGHLAGEVIETPIVYDVATADRILGWMSQYRAFARRSVRYANPGGEWAWLEPGEIVTITDPELYWTSRLAIVTAVRWDDVAPEIVLTMVERPIAESRPMRTGGLGAGYVTPVPGSDPAYAANLYNLSGQTLTNATWEPSIMDTERHVGTNWTSDLVNGTLTQDTGGTVIVLAQPTGYSGTIWQGWRARIELDTGGGFAEIAASDSRAWVDQLTTTNYGAGHHLFAARSGSAGDAYRIGVREDTSGTWKACTYGGNFVAFYAPADVCWATGDATLSCTASYQDVSIAAQIAEGSFSVAADEVVLPDTGDYLVIYAITSLSNVSADEPVYMRLTADTGGGHAEIAGTELIGYSGKSSGLGHGQSIMGHLIYQGTAGDKLKLQARGATTNPRVQQNGTGILVLKLPDDWEGFSGYVDTESGSYTITPPARVDMDTERRKSAFTHDTGSNPGEVTCPAEATVCLVLGTFTGLDTSTHAGSMSHIYSDSGGGFAKLTAAQSISTSRVYSGQAWTAATTSIVADFASEEVIALYGTFTGGTGAGTKNHSQLTILRLDNFGA